MVVPLGVEIEPNWHHNWFALIYDHHDQGLANLGLEWEGIVGLVKSLGSNQGFHLERKDLPQSYHYSAYQERWQKLENVLKTQELFRSPNNKLQLD